MKRGVQKVVFVMLVIAILPTIFAGCGSVAGNAPPATGITGRVFADAPVKNATLSLYDSSGTLICTLQNQTDANGFFWIDLQPGLGSRMRLVVTDGEVVQLGTGKHIRDFDDQMGSEFVVSGDVTFVPVNTLTTILTKYYDLKGKVDVAAAEEFLKKKLGIPGSILKDISLAALNISPIYMGAAFVEKAYEANGLNTHLMIDSFAATVAAKLDTLGIEKLNTFTRRIGDNDSCAPLPPLPDGKTWVPNAKEISGMVKGIIAAAGGDYKKAFGKIGGSLAAYIRGGTHGDQDPALNQIQNSLIQIENQLCNVEKGINQLSQQMASLAIQSWYVNAWNMINGLEASGSGALYISAQWSMYNNLVGAAQSAPGPLSDSVVQSFFVSIGSQQSGACVINNNLYSSIQQMANAAARSTDMAAGGQNLPDHTYLNLALKYYMYSDNYLKGSIASQSLAYDEASMQESELSVFANLTHSYYYILDAASKALTLESEWISYCTALQNGLKPQPGNDDYNMLVYLVNHDQSAYSLSNNQKTFVQYATPMAYEYMRGVAAVRSLDINEWTTSCCSAAPAWLASTDIPTLAWETYLLSLGVSTSVVFELKLPWQDKPTFSQSYLAANASKFGVTVTPGAGVSYSVAWPFGTNDQTFLSPLQKASTAAGAGEDAMSAGQGGYLNLPLYIEGPNKDWAWNVQPYQPFVGYVATVPDSLQGQTVTVSPAGAFDGSKIYMSVPFFGNNPSAAATLVVPTPSVDDDSSPDESELSTFTVTRQSDPTFDGVMLQYVVLDYVFYPYLTQGPPFYFGQVYNSGLSTVSGISYNGASDHSPLAVYSTVFSMSGVEGCPCGSGAKTCGNCSKTWSKGNTWSYISKCKGSDIVTAPVRAVANSGNTVSPLNNGKLNINFYGSYKLAVDNFPEFFPLVGNSDSFDISKLMDPKNIVMQTATLGSQDCTEPHRNCHDELGPGWEVSHFVLTPGYASAVATYCSSH